MNKIIIPLCLFGILASLFLSLGGIGNSQPNIIVTEDRPLMGDGWHIAPCKYTYGYWESARVSTTISNVSDNAIEVALGDGQTAVIEAGGNLTHSYQVSLKGQIERIRITKLAEKKGGIIIQEGLILKIEPEKKGGD